MLNYQIKGNGPPLLMIHGFGISFSIWEGLLPYLTPYFSLILVELPGVGRSPLPDRAVYLDAAVEGIEWVRCELDIKRWPVFSYSSGTRVGEHYVRICPQHVERIVYLCPAQVQWYKAVSLRFAKWLDARYPRAGDFLLSGARLEFLIQLLGFSLERTPHVTAWMREISSQPVWVLKETIRSLPGDGREAFPKSSMPQLFVWGRRDYIGVPPRSPAAHERLIHAAHAAPVTNPWEVAEAALPFLKST